MTDLKFAVRQLLNHPGFTSVAVLTFGILDLRIAIAIWFLEAEMREAP